MASEDVRNELDRLFNEYIGSLYDQLKRINTQSATQKHHYVPKFYLEHFTHPKTRKITIVDKTTGKLFEQTPGATGFEKDFYIVGERHEEGWHVSTEIFWSLIESDVAPIYNKLLRQKQLDLIERVIFSLFVASMICRSRSGIRMAQEMAGAVVNNYMQRIARDEKLFKELFGNMPEPPAILGASTRELFLNGKILATGNKTFSSTVAPSASIKLSPHILHMAWRVCKPTRQLITSDTPALAFSPESLLRTGGKIGGVAIKKSNVVFPMTPDGVFMCAWDVNSKRIDFPDLSKKQTRNVNNVIVSAADRFVYLARPYEEIVKFIRNRKDTKIVHKSETIETANGHLMFGGQHINNFKE